ncbi:MAG TPA: STAS domain-containing protein [Actinospica sp.]|nr:STAS domain-containing protein [Actinospica sp.]
MSAALTLTRTRRPDGTPVLRVVGEIDRSNSPEFAAAVEKAVDAGAGRLTVDLSGVGYLDSAGLSVLFAHADEIRVVVSELLAPVLVVSGLAQLAEIAVAQPRRD